MVAIFVDGPEPKLDGHSKTTWRTSLTSLFVCVCVEVLQPSQPNGSCRARSVYLTTRLLGRLCPLSG